MSSATRTTSKGGKASKSDTSKSHKHDKSDTGGKGSDKQQHTGGGDNARSKNDDPGIKEKVRQVMEMTRRSEEEVCLALHECDHDAERAINMLYEIMVEGEWETSSKKKKNRQASTSKAETEEKAPVDEWNEASDKQPADKEKPRNKSGGGPPRLHGRHNDSRGWRGRENKENERNLEEGQDRKDRRGRGGHNRGGGIGRGRGGGRAGTRFPRNTRNNFSTPRTIDTWDNATTWESTTITNSTHANFTVENWDDFPQADDWSTEEYTGSLADTKVFTPSAGPGPSQTDGSVEAKPGGTPVGSLESMPQIVGTLNAAQTQYLNQLTQQNSENIKQQYASGHPSQPYGNSTPQQFNSNQTYANSSAAGSQPYNSSGQQYGSSPVANTFATNNYPIVNSSYSNASEAPAPAQQQPVRTKTQRARVPPPSKIPSSAVEMPGDLNSMGYLDVQFGAMDFMSESATFDAANDTKFSPTNENLTNSTQTQNASLDLNQANQNASMDAYSTPKANTQNSSISSALSQSLANTDSIPQTSEHLPGSYNTAPRSSAAANATPTATPAGLDLNKQQTETHSYSQPSSYNSYQPKTTTYQAQSYSSSNYNSTQTTSNSYVNNNASSYNTPNAGNAYQNSYSSATSYQGSSNPSGFSAMTQANSYPTNNQYHQQTAQSVYGTNAGLSNNSYGGTGGSSQYSNYNANTNKVVKDGSYENSATTVMSNTTSTTSNVNTSALSQTTTTGTKSTTTALAKNTSNVVSNIPPTGVTPVMSTQYIMGQVPYFQHQIYSIEDMQLFQQRIPHMTTGYYDMSYQTPTTLAAVRDGALANVAYSISDGRFTRGDNNTSPVPSTLSQQTSTLSQGHQAQPMLAAQTGAAPFFYATPYNPMQPTYQFGAVYPQLPAVTNAHGSNNSQYPKQATYGSGYGSGYDQLSQTQDYGKGGYVGNTQGQTKGTGANASSGGSSANDLTMYGKSHTALGKVNSYDKQGFHSGTPPPFQGTLHGNQSTGLAPSGTTYGTQMYIPGMPQHHQHSTPLIHQPLHQMEVRHQGRRMDSSNTSGQRSQASSQAKSGAKQGYPNYWNQA